MLRNTIAVGPLEPLAASLLCDTDVASPDLRFQLYPSRLRAAGLTLPQGLHGIIRPGIKKGLRRAIAKWHSQGRLKLRCYRREETNWKKENIFISMCRGGRGGATDRRRRRSNLERDRIQSDRRPSMIWGNHMISCSPRRHRVTETRESRQE
jgi:hypothetical protein